MHKRYTPEQLARLSKAKKQYEQSGNDYAIIDEYFRKDNFNNTKLEPPITINKSRKKEKKTKHI
ncbi:MAG: hypothetical protein N4A31_03680 [Rickettsiales bacterium]|jgi:hypothetical protein|nr:hypothetical protein [Rickettsiales bacterium]